MAEQPQQLRTEAGNSLLGVSLALGVLMDGLETRVSLSILSDDNAAELHRLLAATASVAVGLAELGQRVRGR